MRNTLFFWLLSALQEDMDAVMTCNSILATIKQKVPPLEVIKALGVLFPRVRHTWDKSLHDYVFSNVAMKLKENSPPTCTVENIQGLIDFLPRDIVVLSSNPSLVLGVPANASVNDSIILKMLTVMDHKCSLSVRGKTIDLEVIGMPDTVSYDSNSINTCIALVKKIQLCEGVKINEMKGIDITGETSETYKTKESETTVIRSKKCSGYCTWKKQHKVSSCSRCYNYKKTLMQKHKNEKRKHAESENQEISEKAREHKQAKKCESKICDIGDRQNIEQANVCNDKEIKFNIQLSADESNDFEEILEQHFQDAPANMKTMIRSQQAALSCKSTSGRRWDKNVISWCLSLWTRSPKGYAQLCETGFIILPSGRQLARYKNRVPQAPGLQDEHLRWMKEAAESVDLPPRGYCGGIIHDETKIQEDLITTTRDNISQLVGWVDLGREENRDIQALHDGKYEQKLATDVLQLVFLGHTGFRFPIAHYPTTGTSASQLSQILWHAETKLYFLGFQVDFILQDGGRENRLFIKDSLPSGMSKEEHKFLTKSSCNPRKQVALCQDYSHNLKKIRNNLLKSGTQHFHKRCIVLNGHPVVWEHWLNAVEWDREVNSRPIHHKITDAHLLPSSTEKMRNHLAEEVLNIDALLLMKSYQGSLPDGSHLDGTVELLTHTSDIISIFRDHIPVKSMDDRRLFKLTDMFRWLTKWRLSAKCPKNFLSKECADDVENMLVTFPEVCRLHLTEYPESGVVPSRFNSDLVENFFCQQRGIYSGNSTNPTYRDYCTNVNAVVLGQSLKSRGRHSNTGLAAADPLSLKKTVY